MNLATEKRINIYAYVVEKMQTEVSRTNVSSSGLHVRGTLETFQLAIGYEKRFF